MSFSDHEDEALDPRIKDELDKLNSAADEINKLEKELGEARGKFRLTLTDSSSKLNALLKKHRKSISRARKFYTTSTAAKKTQCEAQQAAVQFRRASSFYIAAKETISLAEARLNDSDVEFDEAWQEMLNHSTMKMMDAEKEKMRSELEHHRKSLVYQQLEHEASKLAKSQRRSIAVARPYYELKQELELQLQQQKQNVEDLQRGVAAAKDGYKSAMVQLERISEEIHSQRNLPLPIREPGVGCETEEFVTEIDLEKQFDFGDSCSEYTTDTDSIFSSDCGSIARLSLTDSGEICFDPAFDSNAFQSPVGAASPLHTDDLSEATRLSDMNCRDPEGQPAESQPVMVEESEDCIETRDRNDTLIAH